MGGALGIAITVVLIGGTPSPDSLRHGWILSACLFVAVMVLGTTLRGLRVNEPESEADLAPSRGPVGFEAALSQRRATAIQDAHLRPSDPVPADDTLGFLASIPMFSSLSPAQLTDILGITREVRIRAGEHLFRRGDPAETLYVVRAGRLDVVFDDGPGGGRRAVGRGSVLGELALLAQPHRSATVQARRDSELIAISRADFEVLLLAIPEVALALAKQLAGQLQQQHPVGSPGGGPLPTVIAVFGAGADATELGRRLGQALTGTSATLDGSSPAGEWPTLLDRLEGEQSRVILLAPGSWDEAWAGFCASQADAVVVAAAGPPPAQLPATAAPRSVVMDATAASRDWVRPFAQDAAFFSGPEATDRLGRRLSGRANGLVLSGGGARALAHLGVLAELEAHDVTVDRVAGAGIGALVGALLASGWSAAQIDAACYAELVRRKPFSGYHLSRSSLIGSDRAAAMVDRLLGDTWIEELPLQFACVSVDLIAGARVTHRRGPVAEAVLAAITLPGFMEPQAVGGQLLVDAAGLDNVPLDVLARTDGPVIVVDAAPRERGVIGIERSRATNRSRGGMGVPLPSIAEALSRSLVLGSCAAAEDAHRRADLCITPDTAGVGLLEFHQLDVLREAGQRAARAALEG